MKKKAIAMMLTLGMIVGNISGITTGNKQIPENGVSGYAVASAASGPAIDVPTVTAPAAPSVTQIRGGSKRVKLYWNKVDDATGYYIYYSTSQNGTYTRIKTISDSNTLRYVKKSLTQNKTYYFRMSSYRTVGTTTVEGPMSTVYSAKTVSVSSTSKAAKKYSTLSKFKKSAAYKKFSFLNKKANYNKTFALPGMKSTNVAGFTAKKMIPQGMCTAGAYILISAYDKNGDDESVIYVMSRSSKSYITTIVLPNKTKAGGIAYDSKNKNIWISNGKAVSYIPYDTISKAVTTGDSYTEVAEYSGTYTVPLTASYIGYYNGMLWVGAFHENKTSNAYGYQIGSVDGKPSLTYKNTMSMPSRTRAITFDSEGYLYLTRSSRTKLSMSGYISQVRTFAPSYSTPNAAGAIKKNKQKSTVTLPPMAKGVTIYASNLYISFSGCQYSSCKYPVDRVVAVKWSKLR